jgi:hypothetical protein
MSLTDAIHAALDRRSRVESVAAVHEIVANGLRGMDPSLEIHATDYFNHSYVPDLVLQWGSDNARHERHLHLRYRVSDMSFEEDLRLLRDGSPVFLGITDVGRLHDARRQRDRPELNGTLISQSSALDRLLAANDTDHRGTRLTRQIVRAGHGAVDAVDASTLGAQYLRALHGIDSLEDGDDGAGQPVSDAIEALSAFLTEQATIEVERALQSEWIRHGRDPDSFPGRDPWRPELLDTEALREVLVALLDSPRPVPSDVWVRNASHIAAEDIGRVLGESRRGGKLNEMVHALLPSWTAKWAWAERLPSGQLIESYDWLIAGERLAIEGGDLRVSFADDGRHFKDKPEGEGLVPTLTEAQRLLAEPGLLEVRLQSPVEGWRWMPLGQTGPVYERLSGLPEAAHTRLYSVRAQIPATDRSADIDLDRQIVDTKGDSAPISTLAQLAFRFFSRAPDIARVVRFLAIGEDAVARHQGNTEPEAA